MALSLYHDKTHSIDEICDQLHISRSTLFRYVRQAKQTER
jgi:predicted transcriptional regulator YheO